MATCSVSGADWQVETLLWCAVRLSECGETELVAATDILPDLPACWDSYRSLASPVLGHGIGDRKLSKHFSSQAQANSFHQVCSKDQIL